MGCINFSHFVSGAKRMMWLKVGTSSCRMGGVSALGARKVRSKPRSGYLVSTAPVTSNPSLLSKLSKKMVKLSRFKSGWSKTSTELLVLDFACTATLKRLKSENNTAPIDGSIVVYAVPSL